jgi:exodeoxyribonuclease VII large subunit
MQPSLFEITRPALSVTDITRHIRQLIDTDEVLQDIWLEGEISNWSQAASGHIYFTLKDAGASIRCIIWRSTASRLRYRPAGSGEAVLAHGRVSVYEAGGAYQFYVDDMEAAGLGALYAEFERLKNQLAAEGLFDPERKRPLPILPARIGIVTSTGAAALRDVLNVLSRRYPLAEVILSPATVQGDDAPPQIVASLERLAALSPQPDVILLVRGGGSIEDLWAFNDEAVARAVAGSPIPVVTGVGHETDFTIVDFVADHRAPTPSAAAELITPDGGELKRQVTAYQNYFHARATALVTEARSDLQDHIRLLNQLSPQRQLDNRRQQVDDIVRYLVRLLRHRLALHQERLTSAQARLSALNPSATLARGYAIVKKGEQPVTSAGDVVKGDIVTVTVRDGEFDAEVH